MPLAIRISLLFLLTLLAACGRSSPGRLKNEVDRAELSPGEEKPYVFMTDRPIEVGVMIAHDVSGGIVQLKQSDGSAAGTGHYFISYKWWPVDGKVDLTLVNNSKTRVETVVFKGGEPEPE
jgi:hypothetical protein